MKIAFARTLSSKAEQRQKLVALVHAVQVYVYTGPFQFKLA